MAEANFHEFVAGGDRPRAVSSGAINVIGALTTLALVAGVAVWGYNLAVRDASGIPVIQAMEGPMRSAPENAGGKIAPHTGLSVNRVAADGSAAPVPEQLILAEAPIGLEEEDRAGVGTAAPAAEVESDTMARTLAMAEELARQVAAEVAAVSGAPTEAEPPLESGATFANGAPAVSLRPLPRPSRFEAGAVGAPPVLAGAGATPAVARDLAPISAIVPTSSGSASAELALSDLLPGTRLAQIGAYDDIEIARQEWARIAARHPALFEGKQRVIQTASSVGRTFYRLRVSSFASEDDTRRFCSAISAADLRCISVIVR